MDERKTLTNSEGKTLFVDGFTTNETSRGNATLDGESYTYYFNPFYENVITLYEGNDPTYYVSVNGDKYELIGATIDQENLLLEHIIQLIPLLQQMLLLSMNMALVNSMVLQVALLSTLMMQLVQH